MNSEISLNSAGASTTTPIKIFKYRWIILCIYVLVAINNFMQLLQFTIIANILTKYYDVESFMIDLTGLIFFMSFIIFFYPISYLIEKYNLKFAVVIAISLTLAGNALKLLAVHPNAFWIILIAQFLISVGQVYLSSIPSKLATTWFGSEEVSTACAVAVLGMQLGSALGSVQSPFLVTNGEKRQVESQLFDMFLYQAITSAIVFGLVVSFFRSQPSLPPSQSQLNLISNSETMDSTFFKNMKEVAKNKNFWFIVFSLGMANGVWNSFGILINSIYLKYFPSGESDAGLITLITIISGGCIGSMFFGVILDKTHNFKRVSFGVLLASAVMFVFVVISLIEKSRIATFIIIPIFGFFIAPVLIIGFEYLVEITYPIPEACSASTFNAAFYVLSIVASLLFEALFGAIGYNYTYIVILVILTLCAVIIWFVDSDLKRRDANLRHNADNESNVESYSTYSTNVFSTTVTDARF